MSQTVGFIGCGKMGGALARAFVRGGVLAGGDLLLHDAYAAVAEELAEELGACAVASPLEVVRAADIVVLAVKPQQLPELMAELAESLHRPRIWVSVAAGVPLARLRDGLGEGHIVRTMPNRPALVAAGITALMGDAATSSEAVGEVERLFAAAGQTVRLEDEGLFDAVTALSGSGPAFVFRLIEALVEGGVSEGLPRETARALAVSTALGASRLLEALGTEAADERVAVSSPGGTTVAGLAVLEEQGFFDAVVGAIEAAARRSRELGKGS